MVPIPPMAIPPQPSISPTPPSPPPVPPAEPPIFPPPPPKKKSFVWLIIPLLIFLLPLIAYFVFQINKFKQQLNQPTSTANPSPVATLPSPSPSLTADWATYTNQIQNYSFQYPSEDWQINETSAKVDINNKLTLTKGNYIITIYANIQGIGGGTKKVPSIPITVAGLNLYKRDIGDNLYDNTGSFEISASDSSPTFKYQDKTYEIYLTYPLAEKGTEAYLANLKEFDLLLSTFRFTEKTNSSCLSDFKLYQNRVFSVCQPSAMTETTEEYPAHDRPNVQAVKTVFEDSQQKIVIMTVFTGGWGGGYSSEKTTLDTYSATKLTAMDTNKNLTNIIIVTDNNQTGQFPIAIDYQRKTETGSLDNQLFQALIQSFKLK